MSYRDDSDIHGSQLFLNKLSSISDWEHLWTHPALHTVVEHKTILQNPIAGVHLQIEQNSTMVLQIQAFWLIDKPV